MGEHNNQSIEDTHSIERQLRILIEEVRASFEQLAKSITEQIEGPLRQVQEQLRVAVEVFPRKSREALTTLGEHGWYLDPAMSLPETSSLAESLKQGDVETAGCILADHYRARFPQIMQELVSWYPKHAKILTSAFGAHQRGEHELSVPVFLAQADGICKTSLGVSLYSRQKSRREGNRIPATAKAVETRQLDQDSIEAAMLHPLKIPLPISASKDELAGLLNVLNRHEVLHGTSVDYGTEVNSLKAISLLYYVASVLPKPDDNNLFNEQN